MIFGIVLGIYGLARLFVLKKLMEQSEDQEIQGHDQTPAPNATTDDFDSDPKGEYAQDEWESKLESYLVKHYENKQLNFEDSQTKSKSKHQ